MNVRRKPASAVHREWQRNWGANERRETEALLQAEVQQLRAENARLRAEPALLPRLSQLE